MSVDLEALFDDGRLRHLAPGRPLFHGGDPVQEMFLVIAGVVVVSRQTGAGTALVLHRAEAGQILAEASAYSLAYHCDARATVASVVKAVPVARFRARSTADATLADAWAGHLAGAVQAARWRAELRTLRTVAERLDAWLAAGHALPEKGHRHELAAELGVSREALYRELAARRG